MTDFLNWRTDLLLVDEESTEVNQWLTANDLIEKGQLEKIITQDNQFQLYSIMIRKQDFVHVEIGSEQVLFVHGNKIGVNSNLAKKTGVELAIIQAKKELIKNGRSWLPKVTEDTHLVVGHLHFRFYNEWFRVYGLGHWLMKGTPYHQKCIMVLNPTKGLDTIRIQQV